MAQDSPTDAIAETPCEGPPDAPDAPDTPDTASRYVRIMLVVVIGLGVLLVGGAAVVIGTIIKRVNNPDAVPAKPGFGEVRLSVPADAELVGVENGEARIVLRLRDGRGPLLILLDPRKGEEKGRIRLQPQ